MASDVALRCWARLDSKKVISLTQGRTQSETSRSPLFRTYIYSNIYIYDLDYMGLSEEKDAPDIHSSFSQSSSQIP